MSDLSWCGVENFARWEISRGEKKAGPKLQDPPYAPSQAVGVVMPAMDGRELADKVRKLRPSIRVLFTSGYTEDAIVHRGVEAAHVAFRQKPYAPDGLARKVRAVIGPAFAS